MEEREVLHATVHEEILLKVEIAECWWLVVAGEQLVDEMLAGQGWRFATLVSLQVAAKVSLREEPGSPLNWEPGSRSHLAGRGGGGLRLDPGPLLAPATNMCHSACPFLVSNSGQYLSMSQDSFT